MNKEQQELLDEAYKNFIKSYTGKDDEIILPPFDYINDDGNLMSKNQFITNIKYDYWFSEKWGLKIEERELNHDERFEIYKKVSGRDLQPHISGVNFKKFHFDESNISTKLITLTHKENKIESYE